MAQYDCRHCCQQQYRESTSLERGNTTSSLLQCQQVSKKLREQACSLTDAPAPACWARARILARRFARSAIGDRLYKSLLSPQVVPCSRTHFSGRRHCCALPLARRQQHGSRSQGCSSRSQGGECGRRPQGQSAGFAGLRWWPILRWWLCLVWMAQQRRQLAVVSSSVSDPSLAACSTYWAQSVSPHRTAGFTSLFLRPSFAPFIMADATTPTTLRPPAGTPRTTSPSPRRPRGACTSPPSCAPASSPAPCSSC